MKFRLLVALPLLALALPAMQVRADSLPSGKDRLANINKCLHGGYLYLVGSDGTTFANTGQCVSYAAKGGTFYTGIVIPAGHVATISSAYFAGACDSLEYGYQLDLGQNVQLGSYPGSCGSPPVSAPGAILGPFPTAEALRIYLEDTAGCDYTYYSDDRTHASVTRSGSTYSVKMYDSYFCASPPNTTFPPHGENLGVTVTVK